MKAKVQTASENALSTTIALLARSGVQLPADHLGKLCQVFYFYSDAQPALVANHLRRLSGRQRYLHVFTAGEIAEHLRALQKVSDKHPIEASLYESDEPRTLQLLVVGVGDGIGVAHKITGSIKRMAFDIKWVTAFTYDDPDKYGMFFTVKWTGRGRKKSREELKDELLERLGEDYEICHLAVGHSCLKPPAGLGAGWGSDGCAAPLAAFGLKERSSGFHSGLTPGGEPAQAMLGEERPGGPRSTGKDASMPHRKNRSLDGSLPSSPSTDSGEEIPSRSPAIAGIENARAKLRRAVAESGLTQEEIGIRMGMARSAARAGVSRILSHKNDPRLSTLLALAAALNCPLNDLL